MSYRIVCLIVVFLALCAYPRSLMSASPVRDTVADLDILVDGAAQRRYWHGGRWYVEARDGREYAIRLRNPYGVRVAVALSVDGLNTIDARQTTALDARKWVLGPYETITISGWQTSRTDARRFEFTTEALSYGQALGKTANLGVISAVFFRERVAALRHDTHDHVGREAQQPHTPARAADTQTAAADTGKAREEYAATGMGSRTRHVVTEVWLDLETVPARTVDIRYEFRPQLVKLGILPSVISVDPLQRRERARGFEPGFSPEPPHLR